MTWGVLMDIKEDGEVSRVETHTEPNTTAQKLIAGLTAQLYHDSLMLGACARLIEPVDGEYAEKCRRRAAEIRRAVNPYLTA